jgi:Tim44-like domain
MKKNLAIATLLLLGVLCVSLAWARPGGGHSSSAFGSGHSASSSGDWGGGSSGGWSWGTHDYRYSDDNPENQHPMSTATALLLFVIVVVVVIVSIRMQSREVRSYSVAPPDDYLRQRRSDVAAQLAQLKRSDAQFSAILFLDFAHSLYCKFYSYATQPQFSYLTPFLSEQLQHHFDANSGWRIDEIVINSLHWQDIKVDDGGNDRITLEIDANYTVHQQNRRARYAVVERWQFFRRTGLSSAGPEKMQTLSCPQCGAPAQFTDAGVCGYCGAQVQKGEQQWCVAQRVVAHTAAVSAGDGLASYAEEQGTQLPTIKQNDLFEQLHAWQQRYNLADWQLFWQPFEQDVVRAYFTTIYDCWSRRQWQTARHLLSDRLYESNMFWQNLYAEQNWFNRLDQLRVDQVALCKLDSDAYYEAITVRIFAVCNDYTEDASGQLVGGSKTALRRFSEYWTFVRRTGQERHDKAYSLAQCPSCGAPADNMGQAGECGYCGSKISSGQFSWVLFLIEQDECYRG